MSSRAGVCEARTAGNVQTKKKTEVLVLGNLYGETTLQGCFKGSSNADTVPPRIRTIPEWAGLASGNAKKLLGIDT